jgi:receptor expression-enhancing protein 5/6
MNQVDAIKTKLENALEQKNAVTDLLLKIEEKSGVKRLYIVLGFGAFIALWLMVGYGAQFLSNFIGFVYPAYCSIKAVESKNKEDDTKWLTYWVVYAAFSLMEFFADIFFWWIPLYSFFKCLFFIYCMAPTSWNGSLVIYHRIIRPLALRHQSKIDQALDQAGEFAGEALSTAERELADAAKDAAIKSMADRKSD